MPVMVIEILPYVWKVLHCTPVSYTHLDVYKRQFQYWARNFSLKSSSCHGFTSGCFLLFFESNIRLGNMFLHANFLLLSPLNAAPQDYCNTDVSSEHLTILYGHLNSSSVQGFPLLSSFYQGYCYISRIIIYLLNIIIKTLVSQFKFLYCIFFSLLH